MLIQQSKIILYRLLNVQGKVFSHQN